MKRLDNMTNKDIIAQARTKAGRNWSCFTVLVLVLTIAWVTLSIMYPNAYWVDIAGLYLAIVLVILFIAGWLDTRRRDWLQ